MISLNWKQFGIMAAFIVQDGPMTNVDYQFVAYNGEDKDLIDSLILKGETSM